MRIKYIIPVPMDENGVARRASQIPRDILGDATDVACVPVRYSSNGARSYYDSALFDMYVTDAGLAAEQEGYDAVVMDTVSDSGLRPLRARLSIPVMGPGLVSYAVAIMLGKRFSIITDLPEHRFWAEQNIDGYRLWDKCASIRASGLAPDFEELLDPGDETALERMAQVAREAIEDDGADVILIGSTALHQTGEFLARSLPVPVINPGPVAIKITEAIVQLGLCHSKIGYPSPGSDHDEVWAALPTAAGGATVTPTTNLGGKARE
jgi:allantoin racemase